MELAPVDIAIMAPLVEEWEEMVKHLDAAVDVASWSPAKRGTIGAHSVLCEVAGKGQEEAASALTRTLERAKPSTVILMGIAGGFPALDVHRGDVIVAHSVYSFDYGKLVHGKFVRRPENDYNCDRGLLEFANLVARSEKADWQSRILQPRPDSKPPGVSRAHTDCYVASSNKVVDDPGHEFYANVAASFEEIHAVETEAVGAGASVRLAQSERQLSVLVIRGITDEPGAPAEGGSAHRREWMRYAAAAAAAFTRSLIERLPPKKKAAPDTSAAPSLPPDPLCVGRQGELDGLVHALVDDNSGPIAVLGPLGVGKSTLVGKALHHPEVARRFGARRYFVNCDGCSSVEGALAAIYGAVGVGVSVSPLTLDQVLATVPLVIALDNFETTWEADPIGAEGLLKRIASITGSSLVVAVRGRERPGELPWKAVISLEPLSLPAARECFLSVAGTDFASDPLLDALLVELEFLPHAIALLAHQAQGEPDLADIRGRWDAERSRMLTRHPGTQRITSFELSCELSINSPRMTLDARKALSVLSLLPAGLRRSDLDSLTEIIPVGAPGVLRKLGLVAGDQVRLRVLAPVREFTSRFLLPTRATKALLAAHLLQSVCDNSKFAVPDARLRYRRLAAEIQNIDVAFEIGAREFSYELVCQAARCWAEFLRVTGVGSVRPLELAIRLAGDHGDSRLKAQCLRGLGDVLLSRLQLREALALYGQAVPLLEGAEDWHSVADAYKRMAHAHRHMKNIPAARRLYTKARGLYRNRKDFRGEADCIIGLAAIEVSVENLPAARTLASKALKIYRAVGAQYGAATSASVFASIAMTEGDLELAASLYAEAKETYEELGIDAAMADMLLKLGLIMALKGQRPEAIKLYQEAKQVFQSVGHEYIAESIEEALTQVRSDDTPPETEPTV